MYKVIFLVVLALASVRCDLERQCQCQIGNIKDEDLANVNATRGNFITGAILLLAKNCDDKEMKTCKIKCLTSYKGMNFDNVVQGQTLGQIFCSTLIRNSNQYTGLFATLNGCKDSKNRYMMRHSPQKLCCKNGQYTPGC